MIIAAAFAVRLAAGIWWQERLPDGVEFGFGDSDAYWQLAGSIARGDAYQYGAEGEFPPPARVFRTPGYPLVLAGLFIVAGDSPHVLWGRALSAALGTLAVGTLMWLTAQLFDGRTALVAGMLAAIYPGAVAMSTFILAEAPFCPLMLSQIICWAAAWKATTSRNQLAFSAAGGLIAGAATLVRPSWLLFTPFAIGFGMVFVQRRRKQLLIGACMLVGTIVAMSPWWIRNYQITGHFVPTTLQVGASLYDGLNPQATGASDMRFAATFFREQQVADAESSVPLKSTFEYRVDRRMRDAALDWARNHPADVARLAVIKAERMWNVWPNATEFQSWPVRLVVMIGYAPLILLSLFGVWRFGRRGWPFVLCFLPAIYFTLLHMVFVSSIRYRQPAMLPMIVLAAGIITQLIIPRITSRGTNPAAGVDDS